MRSVSGVGRVAALAAVILAVALVAIVLFGGGGGYSVTATFVNAGQLVNGNNVVVAGVPAGSVEKIQITDDGRARITFTVDDRYAPLRRGTRATIKQASQSGIANRYIELSMPPGERENRAEIDDGGEIPADETSTAVDLDQLFNTLDPETRKALQDFFKGSAQQYAANSEEANEGLRYLSPALSTSRRFFEELNRDTVVLERFLVDSSRLVTAVAERSDDLTNLITNLNPTTAAIGSEKLALAEAIGRFPGFMRRANTTFVNLRATLDDLDPLVTASRPVARKLDPFLDELRPLARDARPTVRDLSEILRTRGPDNDLIDLTRTLAPLADVAVETAERNGEQREGAFQETARATRESAPIISFGRPYTPDLFGWFDDFSTPGVYDALGGVLRFQVVMSAFSQQGDLIPLLDRAEIFEQVADTREVRRCPGGAEAAAPDNSNVYSQEEQERLECDESHRAVDG